MTDEMSGIQMNSIHAFSPESLRVMCESDGSHRLGSSESVLGTWQLCLRLLLTFDETVHDRSSLRVARTPTDT